MQPDTAVVLSRNQALLDALLTRRAQDERRCDLYQRIQHTKDAERHRLERCTAAVSHKLQEALIELYSLLPPQSCTPSRLTVDDGESGEQRLRQSLRDTELFNETLQASVRSIADRCSALRVAKMQRESSCQALEDRLAQLYRQSAEQGLAQPPQRDASGRLEEGVAAAPHSTARTRLLETISFYEGAFAAARGGVTDLIALQDALQPRRGAVASASSTLGVTADSIKAVVDKYADLRAAEKRFYARTLRALTMLLALQLPKATADTLP